MKILVTGGTGFVGSHAVEALCRAGHELRLLARSREKVERVLATRGVSVGDVVLGDMTDAACVRKALGGCEGVLHAAAEVNLGRTADIYGSNVAGYTNVVGCAVELGLDPVLYVSSVATMFPPRGAKVTVEDPVTGLTTDYGRSKAAGELYVRRLQAQDAPVVTFYPSGIYGPDDPGLSDPHKGLRDRIQFGTMITSGGAGSVDVRDLAQIIAAAAQPGCGPRRYMAGGHFVTWAEEADLIEAITGRPIRRIPAPPWLVRAIGRGVDSVKRVHPRFDYPLTHEAALFVTLTAPCESQPTLDELGVGFRPLRETLRDAITMLLERGELGPHLVPALAGTS